MASGAIAKLLKLGLQSKKVSRIRGFALTKMKGGNLQSVLAAINAQGHEVKNAKAALTKLREIEEKTPEKLNKLPKKIKDLLLIKE